MDDRLIPPTQGAPRETDFVKATAEEVERREARWPSPKEIVNRGYTEGFRWIVAPRLTRTEGR
jgi:hypothetical protein